jgi:Calpain family cysteine protease
MSTRWAPNPIALARLAVGGAQKGTSWPDSWSDVEALFGAAYKADARAVFYGSGDVPALVDMLRQAADQVPKPLPLKSALAVPAVRALEQRLSNPEWLARLLPFIVPVSDMGFGPGTGVELTEHPRIGSYERIGALEVGGVLWLDPEQGSTGDCYLISAMISIAWARPQTWRDALSTAVKEGKVTDTLRIEFHGANDGDADPDKFNVPPSVPLDPGHNWIYAHSAEREETWPALIERAFVMQIRNRTAGEPTVDDYREIGNMMFPNQAARILTGGSAFFQVAGPHGPYSLVVGSCEQSLTKNPTIVSTLSEPGNAGGDFAESMLIRNHAYAVLGLMSDGDRNFVVLRNPFGNNPRIADSPGGEWAAGSARNGGVPVLLDRNGVFAISEQRFNACFRKVEGVVLPPD